MNLIISMDMAYQKIICIIIIIINNSTMEAKSSTQTLTTKDPAPVPAKKEDCVFEVTAANFQKLVLESQVPG